MYDDDEFENEQLYQCKVKIVMPVSDITIFTLLYLRKFE